MATSTSTPGVSADDFAEDLANPASFSVEGLSQSNRSMSDKKVGFDLWRKAKRMGRGIPSLSCFISHAVPPGTCDR